MSILLPAASGHCRYCDARLHGNQSTTCGKPACHRERARQRMADKRKRGTVRTRIPRAPLAATSLRTMGVVPTGREAPKERALRCQVCKAFIEWVPALNGFGSYAERCACGLRWISPETPRPS